MGPCRRSASCTMSVTSSTCGSNAAGGERNWNRSCPCCAATSALPRVTRSARLMWSTVTSTPLAVPQSLANLSNHASYEGTKWLHWRILSVFCWRLIRMVGPRARAAAAPAVVVTNSRRCIGFLIDLPSLGNCGLRIAECGIERATVELGCRLRGSSASLHSAFRIPHSALDSIRNPQSAIKSKRVQHAERHLCGVALAGDIRGGRLQVLEPESVAASSEPQHAGDVLVLQPAGGRQTGGLVLIGIVDSVECPQAPAGREIVAALDPAAHTTDVALLRDVPELLADCLPVIEVSVHGELARVNAAAHLDRCPRQVVGLGTGAGRILPVDVPGHVGAPAEIRRSLGEAEQ